MEYAKENDTEGAMRNGRAVKRKKRKRIMRWRMVRRMIRRKIMRWWMPGRIIRKRKMGRRRPRK